MSLGRYTTTIFRGLFFAEVYGHTGWQFSLFLDWVLQGPATLFQLSFFALRYGRQLLLSDLLAVRFLSLVQLLFDEYFLGFRFFLFHFLFL